MAKPYTEISPEKLEELAYDYITECMANTKKWISGGMTHNIKDRHIPTVEYFLRIWIPSKGMPTISKSTYYKWLADKPAAGIDRSVLKGNDLKRYDNLIAKSDAIKNIQELFAALATDIVANEGKGIFFAKNRLGMTDKQEISGNDEQPLFPPLK